MARMPGLLFSVLPVAGTSCDPRRFLRPRTDEAESPPDPPFQNPGSFTEMASGLSNAFVLALFVTLAPGIFGGTSCDSYRDRSNVYHLQQSCWPGFCCGDCYNRYCCSSSFRRLTEDEQDNCPSDNQAPFIGLGVGILIFILAIVICCCVCPCCCLYKLCRKPRPVIATTTTVVTTGPQQYPQQQTVPPGQPIQHYPPYQPMPVQPGYPSQPMPQGYGAQNMPTSPYKGQPFVPGPPPTYQEATGPGYPVAPYSQAAFNLNHPAYPPQPPVHPQPSNPPTQTDFLAQPAYNPDFVAPPPKTG